MDLSLFFRVIWRYRILVMTGLLLAVLAAFFAMVRISPGGATPLSLRGEKEYASYTTLFVTQSGFPWGRLTETDSQGVENAGRLASLATLYSKLADSDPVMELNRKELGDTGWTLESAPVLDGAGLSSPLPLIRIAGLADSPELARRTAATAAASLQSFVTTRQQANNIPDGDRVVLQLIKGPETPILLKDRSFTPPIIAFLLIAMVTIALPFIIDNVRRAIASARAADDAEDDLGRGAGHQSQPGGSFDPADIEERRRVARLSQ